MLFACDLSVCTLFTSLRQLYVLNCCFLNTNNKCCASKIESRIQDCLFSISAAVHYRCQTWQPKIYKGRVNLLTIGAVANETELAEGVGVTFQSASSTVSKAHTKPSVSASHHGWSLALESPPPQNGNNHIGSNLSM